MLDHLSGGRLNFGVAASGLPSDWTMFNVDGMSGQNRDMTREALEIICGCGPKTPVDPQRQILDRDQNPTSCSIPLNPISSRCRRRIRRSALPA